MVLITGRLQTLPQNFEDCRHDQCLRHGDGARSHRRADIVGDVVGADIHCHVAGERHRGDDNQISWLLEHIDSGKNRADDQEENAKANARPWPQDMLRGLFSKGYLVQIFVEGGFFEAQCLSFATSVLQSMPLKHEIA